MSRAALSAILDHVRTEPSRTWSIIITLFGDAILPRGGSVWLGTLLTFFRSLDIAEGVVRTAMSRLAADGWLERNRVGRNSFYHLAEKGRATFDQAAERIYRPRAPAWPGYFESVLLDPGVAADPNRSLLQDAGFAQSMPGLWIAPGGAATPPGLTGALWLRSSGDDQTSRALAARSWRLDEIAVRYRRFLDTFAPLETALSACAPLSDLDAIVARVLLIHDYRRIALADPILPLELLPLEWPGTAARALCSTLYPLLLPASERWLDINAANEDGPLPSGPDIFRRFR